MSWYLQADEREPVQVASIGGLRELRAVAEGEVAALLERGWSEEPAKLRADLAALDVEGPVADTAKAMFDAITDDDVFVSLTDLMQ